MELQVCRAVLTHVGKEAQWDGFLFVRHWVLISKALKEGLIADKNLSLGVKPRVRPHSSTKGLTYIAGGITDVSRGEWFVLS